MCQSHIMAMRCTTTRSIIDTLQAALVERQTLLTEPETDQMVRRADVLGLHMTELLGQLETVYPPQRSLGDQESMPGEFDRFLDGGHSQRLAA